jgi:hypothetical protein
MGLPRRHVKRLPPEKVVPLQRFIVPYASEWSREAAGLSWLGLTVAQAAILQGVAMPGGGMGVVPAVPGDGTSTE